MDIVDRLLQGRCDPGPTSDPHECELPSDECPCAIRVGAAAEITSLRRERDEALAAMAWRPIETAPKDGTRLWLYWPKAFLDDRQCVGWWVDDPHEGGRWVDSADQQFDPPSHWRELPPLPEITK
jgi:hypothetical protein